MDKTGEGASPTAAELSVVEELTAATGATADTGKKEDAGASSDEKGGYNECESARSRVRGGVNG
ncbi:hypothetical protein PI125_g22321 [Phytophthora idaei]|nr:hypothetical protein PI125_g22321 [Phytophthora idaei]